MHGAQKLQAAAIGDGVFDDRRRSSGVPSRYTLTRGEPPMHGVVGAVQGLEPGMGAAEHGVDAAVVHAEGGVCGGRGIRERDEGGACARASLMR